MRNAANNFSLPTDPAVWGDAYHKGIAQYGDNGTNCVLCGKRTGGKKNTALVLVSHRGTALPPAELPTDGTFDESTDTLGCSPIGSECKKKLPAAYLLPGW